MKPINNFYWQLYTESEAGQKVISDFSSLLEGDLNPENAYGLWEKYNPTYFMNADSRYQIQIIEEAENELTNWLTTHAAPTSIEESIVFVNEFLDSIIDNWMKPNCNRKKLYQILINYITPISVCLFRHFPEFYIPYFYILDFRALEWVFEEYNIEQPKVPAKYDYPKRCYYYASICEALYHFRTDEIQPKQLTPLEMCAFLYGLCANVSKEDLKNYPNTSPRVWFIGGNFKDGEQQNGTILWECNTETREGDILLFYETSSTEEKTKRSCMTSIWRAKSDGYRDPLFHFYSCALIGDKIDIAPIRINILKEDTVVGKIGIVNGNFQGVSGDPVKPSEYRGILNLIQRTHPDFDMSKIYTLPEPEEIELDTDINNEADVENKLILMMLERMGFGKESKTNRMFQRQVPLQLGRDKKPEAKGKTDFSLFTFGPDRKYADVLIETKHACRELRNEADMKVVFNQAESYAAHQYAGLMIIISDKTIRLFFRGKDGIFEYNNDKKNKYDWSILKPENYDKFEELKNIIYSYNVHKMH